MTNNKKVTTPDTYENSVQSGKTDSFLSMPVVTKEQQEKVIKRLAEQERLRIYRPEVRP